MKIKLLVSATAILSMLTVSMFQLPVRALDNSPDYDNYAVIYGGVYSPDAARNKYDQGSKIFGAMGIQKSEITNDMKQGIVYRDGRVVVDGKVVATNARTAIRNMSGGSPIAGTNAAIYSASRMSDDQTAMVKMTNGKFQFAIMKPCGNPVTANPVPQPNPSATCDSLKATPVSRTKFNFVTHATAKEGAKVKSYTYTVHKNGQLVDTKSIPSSQESNTYAYTQTNPGNYTVKVVVETSEGPRGGESCTASFSVKEASNPGVTIAKTVNGKEHEVVQLNQTFAYQLKVTNTGNVALKNVTVSDKAPEGVQFVSAQPGSITNNVWSYTIPTLAVKQSILVTIQAKVVKTMPSTIINTACVDAKETPTNPDACDTATVDTPKPNMIEVCNPETGTVIMVDEKDKDKYLPKDSDKCANITVCVLETGAIITIKKSEMDSTKYAEGECPVNPKSEPLPEELPTTGPIDTALQVVGAASLAGASGYYLMSRRRD